MKSTFPISASTNQARIRWATTNPLTQDMQDLMSKVRLAMQEGIFYDNDLRAAIVAQYDFTEEELSRNDPPRVVGGVVGMEIYYARKAVEAEEKEAVETAARAALKPTPGMRLGMLKFSGCPLFKNCIVESAEKGVTFLGTRGNKRYRVESTCANILHAQTTAQCCPLPRGG